MFSYGLYTGFTPIVHGFLLRFRRATTCTRVTLLGGGLSGVRLQRLLRAVLKTAANHLIVLAPTRCLETANNAFFADHP